MACAPLRRVARWGTTIMALAALAGCSDDGDGRAEDLGQAEVALGTAPSDVKCLRLTVEGPKRTDVRKFPLTAGQRSTFRLNGLPVGKDTFTAHAFDVKCDDINTGVTATWYSDPVVAQIRAGVMTRVSISMSHNGGASVGIDWGDGNGSSDDDPPLEGGVQSSDPAYVTPLGCPVRQQALLTVGDSPNEKPDGTPYRMVGSPDGLGA